MPGLIANWKISRKLRKSQRLLTVGKDTDALAVLENILSENPDHAEALLWTAVAKNCTKDYEQALEFVDRAMEKSKRSFFCKMVKGETLLFLERHDESLKLLSEALEDSPDNTRISYLMGLNHIRKGDIGKAAEFFEIAIKYDRELVDSRLLAAAELYLYKNK